MQTKAEILSFLENLCRGAGAFPSKFPMLLIAGPCQLESLSHSLEIASTVKEIATSLKIPYIFKGSFDKANRTSVSSTRGVGLEEGKEILNAVSSELNIPCTTDVHTPEQAQALESTVDILQIPAFLCRQTDLLIAAGKFSKFVNIKKGQFLHPTDMKYAAEKVQSGGCKNIMLCERGSSFGYRDLVVDMRALKDMRDLGFPVIFDGTHSVQSMGGADGSSTGAKQYIPTLCRAAIAAGVGGLFLEVHDKPHLAPSDGDNMIVLSELKEHLNQFNTLHNTLYNTLQEKL